MVVPSLLQSGVTPLKSTLYNLAMGTIDKTVLGIDPNDTVSIITASTHGQPESASMNKCD